MSDQPVDQSFVRDTWEDAEHARDYIDAVTTVGLWESERTLMDRYAPRNGAVLDIGCGAGRTTFGLYEAGYRGVTGFDLSNTMIEAARRITAERGLPIRFDIGDAASMPYADAIFDGALFSNSEDECRELLESVRWPDGVQCPRCENDNVSEIRTRTKYDCLRCCYVFSVTSGTALHKTHLPLRKWIIATYMMSESKKGMSANQLKRMLHTTYKTAWYMNHRIRNALSNVYTDKLSNTIEVDETFVGGKVRGMGQGYTGNKALVVGIVERKGDIVLKVRESRTRDVLHEFVLSHVDPDAVAIFTDDWPAYRGLPKHDTVNHSIYEYVRGDVHTNTVENVWSLLKRSIVGTFHHMSIKHLELYLEELAWRYSNRDNDVFMLTLSELLKDGNKMHYVELIA